MLNVVFKSLITLSIALGAFQAEAADKASKIDLYCTLKVTYQDNVIVDAIDVVSLSSETPIARVFEHIHNPRVTPLLRVFQFHVDAEQSQIRVGVYRYNKFIPTKYETKFAAIGDANAIARLWANIDHHNIDFACENAKTYGGLPPDKRPIFTSTLKVSQ